ncbi:amidase family protein [Streptomyces malaysiensis]|uniref:amidase family protein n=1 Tax=Streptomyces malaysiensis TaxID=92644 RepID=UPI0040471312
MRCHGYSAAGWLSPVELTESVLGRIATMEEDLNAYVTVVAESARRAAARAEREIAAAGHRSPLHGQPQSAPISWMYAPEAFGASGEDGFASGGRR